MISGAPAKSCKAITSAAGTLRRPPSTAARSPSNRTQGNQPSAAVLFGHINPLMSRPLKA